jgi:hypothetical protein
MLNTQTEELVTTPSMWTNVTNLAQNVTQEERPDITTMWSDLPQDTKASAIMTAASIVDSTITWVTLAAILFFTVFLVAAPIVRCCCPGRGRVLGNRIRGILPKWQNVEKAFLALILIGQLAVSGICGSEIYGRYGGWHSSLIILAVIAVFAVGCAAAMIYDRLRRGKGSLLLGEIWCIVMQFVIICLTLALCCWIVGKTVCPDSIMSTWERILCVLQELHDSWRTSTILCILTMQLRLTVSWWCSSAVGMELRRPILGSEKKGPTHADSEASYRRIYDTVVAEIPVDKD